MAATAEEPMASVAARLTTAATAGLAAFPAANAVAWAVPALSAACPVAEMLAVSHRAGNPASAAVVSTVAVVEAADAVAVAAVTKVGFCPG